MNILTDEQAEARQLALPIDSILADLPPEFIAELQLRGTFVEYNQQAIVSAGQSFEYVSCIVSGRAKIARIDSNYAKIDVGTLGAGQWFGEVNLFVRNLSAEEVFADGEVIVWTMPPETLRRVLLEEVGGVQLLYNIATLMAKKLASHADIPLASAGTNPK
jgi:CRP-like cAMP-binding protein